MIHYTNIILVSYYLTRITDFVYKLASITALYIALKVHNRTTIKASTLSSLSRGEITVSDIIDMESLMLDTLSYHLCPPTCYTFISLFYAFVPASVRERVGHPLMQHAIYLTELSVMDISFQSVKASHIALAAMLNVMEVMGEEAVPSWARSRFVRDVEECMLKHPYNKKKGMIMNFPLLKVVLLMPLKIGMVRVVMRRVLQL
jgi:Cyclin